MKQYNGAFGCSHCEDEGQPRPASHLQRNWPYKETCTLRTHPEMIECAKTAIGTGTVVSTNDNRI